MLTQIIPVDGFTFTSRQMTECQNGRENSNCSSAPPDKSFGDVWVQRIAFKQAVAFSHTIRMGWLMDCPTLPGVTGARDYLHPADFGGVQDYWVVWAEETVALAKALKRCAVHSGMPPGVLWRVVQELCECLTSVIQSGNLVDLEMLDMAEKDPMAPTSEVRALLPMPRKEPLVSVTSPSEPSTLEPEDTTPPEECALVPRWRPLLPLASPS